MILNRTLLQALFTCGVSLVLASNLLAQPSVIEENRQIANNPKSSAWQKAQAFNIIASEFLFLNHDSVAFYASQAHLLAEQNELWDQLCEYHSVQGYSFVFQARPTAALAHFQQGARLAQTHGLDSCLAKQYSGMGELYEERKEYRKAYLYYSKAMQSARRQPAKQVIADINFDLFSALYSMGRLADADHHYYLSERGYKQSGDSLSIAMLVLHKARLLAQTGRYNAAIPLLKRYKALISVDNFEGDPAAYHLSWATIEFAAGNTSAGMKHTDSARRWSMAMGEQKTVADAFYIEARMLKEAGRLNQAFAYADSAIGLYDQVTHHYDLRQALLLALCIDSALQNKTALEHHWNHYVQVAEASMVRNAAFEEEEFALLMKGEERQRAIDKEEINKERQTWKLALTAVAAATLFILCALAAWHLFLQRRQVKQLKALQVTIDQRNEHLQRMNDVKNKLLSIMSHELRSPLTSLQGLLNMLHVEGISYEEFLGFIPILEAEAQNSLFLLDNLLFWIKSQMQGIQLRKEMMPVAPMVQEVADLFQTRLIKKEITIRQQIDAGAIAMVDGDIARLVIRNVVNNAIKFSPKGQSILISDSQREHSYQLHIQDAGAGIEPNILEQIKKGQIVNAARGTGQEKGAGIGLQFSLDLLRKMGGNYIIESTVGKGTTFTILFPTQ